MSEFEKKIKSEYKEKLNNCKNLKELLSIKIRIFWKKWNNKFRI